MKLTKIFLAGAIVATVGTSCKDELDVKTFEPAVATITKESDLTTFALGSVYRNGFVDLKFTDGVMGAFWGTGYHDLMADVVSAEAANVYINQLGCPETVTFGDGTVITNPGNPTHQPALLRQTNLNSNAGNNPSFYEWSYMYSLNNVANNLLVFADQVTYDGDATTKANVVKAWAYWWKGFAYYRIGSMYYAGIITDEANAAVPSPTYVSAAAIRAESEKNLAACETLLNGLTANDDYMDMLGSIIPSFFQVGHGGVPTPDMWKRNINTLRARMLLANTRFDEMTSTQWNTLLTLTDAGIQEGDVVFTGRTNGTADIFSPNGGFVQAKTTGDPKSTATYKITERLIQDFQDIDDDGTPDDNRFKSNFIQLASPWIGESSRGNAFNTRWQLVDGGNTTDYPDTYVFSDREEGATELYMAGSYEENALIRAEALIMTGDIAGGTALIDAVREYQGAGLPAIGAVTQDEALEQLRSERRIGLIFRWVAFYDARRWGVIDPVASGGGRTDAVVVTKDGVVHTDATLDFQFLDYWDVPDNELKYNPPADGSAETKNPKN